MFGVHRNTILYRIARGELRAFRRGNRWRIGLSALRDVAEQWESVMLRERLSR